MYQRPEWGATSPLAGSRGTEGPIGRLTGVIPKRLPYRASQRSNHPCTSFHHNR
jgi:hypothetical protein